MSQRFEVSVRIPVVSAAYRTFQIAATSPEEAMQKLKEQASVDVLMDEYPEIGLADSWTDADGDPWFGPSDIFMDYLRLVVEAGFDDEVIADRLRKDHRVAGGYPCLNVMPF